MIFSFVLCSGGMAVLVYTEMCRENSVYSANSNYIFINRGSEEGCVWPPVASYPLTRTHSHTHTHTLPGYKPTQRWAANIRLSPTNTLASSGYTYTQTNKETCMHAYTDKHMLVTFFEVSYMLSKLWKAQI